jgi:hypothetical protein
MKQIPLNGKHGKGKFALVDDEDYEELMQYRWFVSTKGYVKRGKVLNGKYKDVSLHRFILQAKKGLVIDHINHNKLDNQKANLRQCTNAENMSNMISQTGISKFKGVSFDKKLNKWRAQICFNYKQKNLGSFDTELEAAQAYNTKALELFGEFAHINKI